MAKTTTLTVTIADTGDGVNYSDTQSQANTSGFGSGDQPLVLSAGFNSLTAPTNTSIPVRGVRMMTDPASTNLKIIKGAAADNGFAWTNQIVVLPMVAAASWGINATAGETVRIRYF